MKNKINEKTRYIRVNKENAQLLLNSIKRELKNKKIIDSNKKILTEKNFVLFPLIENNININKLTDSCKNSLRFEIVSRKGYIPLRKTLPSLETILKGILPEHILQLIPKSYDIIGNIAIVEFDRFRNLDKKHSLKYKKAFTNALFTVNKSVQSIYEKKSEIKGKYRLREFSYLGGKDDSETIHKENHCLFKLDIKKVFFSPRLVYERNRLSKSTIKDQELIIDMFAGVGPFSIQIAKNYNVVIYSFDFNKIAYNYLQENIKINKLKGKIYPFNMDIKELLKSANNVGNKLKHKADRIIMNLPEKSMDYIDVVCFLMKVSGGILHNYQLASKEKPIEKSLEKLTLALKKNFWYLDSVINSKIVKEFSPKMNLIVLDLMIKPLLVV